MTKRPIVKELLLQASSELSYSKQEIIDVIIESVEDGAFLGSAQIQRMSDDILSKIRDVNSL